MAAGVYLDEMLSLEVAQTLAARLPPAGLRVERAALHLPGAPDPAQLSYARAQQLVLLTRNVADFRHLHQLWHVMRHWGVLAAAHAGILLPTGEVPDFRWAEVVAELLLHPQCPPLEDQLLIWQAKPGRWVADHPYSRRRERPLTL